MRGRPGVCGGTRNSGMRCSRRPLCWPPYSRSSCCKRTVGSFAKHLFDCPPRSSCLEDSRCMSSRPTPPSMEHSPLHRAKSCFRGPSIKPQAWSGFSMSYGERRMALLSLSRRQGALVRCCWKRCARRDNDDAVQAIGLALYDRRAAAGWIAVRISRPKVCRRLARRSRPFPLARQPQFALIHDCL